MERLPSDFNVRSSGRLRWTNREGEWYAVTASGQARGDVSCTNCLFAHNPELSLQGFSPQLPVTREFRTSNAQLHDYERSVGELRFGCSF